MAFQVALNSEIYVDKSGLIKYTNKVLNTLQAYICNSRPRRFGKSITANMLTAYYSRGCNSEGMFAGLEIGKSADFKKHLMNGIMLLKPLHQAVIGNEKYFRDVWGME